jgi:hypothetical protein
MITGSDELGDIVFLYPEDCEYCTNRFVLCSVPDVSQQTNRISVIAWRQRSKRDVRSAAFGFKDTPNYGGCHD